MSNQPIGSVNSGVAVLWDWQNVRATSAQIESLLAFASRRGEIEVKRVYADWQLEKKDRALQEKLDGEGFEVISVFSCKEKPNNVDQKLIQHCQTQILNRSGINTVILISGDSDFTPLVNQLKANGKTVIVVAHDLRYASKKLRLATDEFWCLNQIEFWAMNLRFAA